MSEHSKPESYYLNIIRILSRLRPHVVVSRYPRKKSSIIKYNIPETIEGVPIRRYLSLSHGLTRIDQDFILDNLRHCRFIQPDKNTVTVVGKNEADRKPTTIATTDYGNFHIFGRQHSSVHDPKDLKSTITSYICSYGITALVHVYKFKGQYVTNVYYGTIYDETLSYLKLMSTPTLYNAFVEDNIGQLAVLQLKI